MNSLSNNIAEIIKSVFETYSEAILKEYENVDSEKLEELWSCVCSDSQMSLKKKIVKNSEPAVGCNFVLQRGRPGQICGIKVRTGEKYCTRHSKAGEFLAPSDTITGITKLTKAVATPLPVVPISIEAPKRVFRMDKAHGRYINTETGLFIRSKTDTTVVGSVREGKIVEFLTEEDKATCEKFGFKYEKNVQPEFVLKPEVESKPISEPVKEPEPTKTVGKKDITSILNKFLDEEDSD